MRGAGKNLTTFAHAIVGASNKRVLFSPLGCSSTGGSQVGTMLLPICLVNLLEGSESLQTLREPDWERKRLSNI